MPKPKPTQVIRHEIGLTRDTKEMVEGVVGAYQFNKVSTPIVAALSDVSFLVFLGSVLAAWKVIDEETWKALYKAGDITLDSTIDALTAAYDVAQKAKEELDEFSEGPLGYLLRGLRDLTVGAADFGPAGEISPERAEALAAMYMNQQGQTPTSPADLWRVD